VVSPVSNFLATTPHNPYLTAPAPSTLTGLSAASIPPVGGGQAHENRQPFLTLNLCIALQGIFPSRN
jgi:microcystin-dependent protein